MIAALNNQYSFMVLFILNLNIMELKKERINNYNN
jgi:hypothetical protein